jgi:hypothetical protein
MKQKQEQGARSSLDILYRAWSWMSRKDTLSSKIDQNLEKQSRSKVAEAETATSAESNTSENNLQIIPYRSQSTHARLRNCPQFSQQTPESLTDEFMDQLSASSVVIPPAHNNLMRTAVLMLMGATVASAHHTMTANITMLGPDQRNYLFEFDPKFAGFHDIVQHFIQHACAVNVTNSTFHNSVGRAVNSGIAQQAMSLPNTMLSGARGMFNFIAARAPHVPNPLWKMFQMFERVYPTHEIAALSYSTATGGTAQVQACLTSHVQPLVDSIRESESNKLIAGCIFTILIALVVIGLVIGCCVRSRRPQTGPLFIDGDVRLSPLGTDTSTDLEEGVFSRARK